MLTYARGDVHWCWNLWEKFSDRWPVTERRLSNQTIDQGLRGVQINRKLLDDYIWQTHEMKMNTEKLLPWLEDTWDEEDEFNTKPTSTKCIAEQCRRNGIPCPPVKANEGEEAYEEWENRYRVQHPWIASLSTWRSVNKLYKTFLTVKERLRDDDTLPFALKYFGAHTGRWSGDAKVNMQNMRRRPVICNEHGLMETNEHRIDSALDGESDASWIKHQIDFRHLIVPRPGKKMIVSDLSQIEPRVLAWLCGDNNLLDLVRSGMSLYEAHARTALGWTGGNLKKENPALYQEAKARVLALGYGAGWEKYIAMAALYTGMDLTADDPEWISQSDPATGEMKQVSGYGQRAKQSVQDFRLQNPLIAGENGIWKRLEGSFRRSVGEDFVVTLPSGRKITYEHVKAERRIEPDPETGKPRSKSVFTAGIGGRRVITYGGKLTENLVQAVSRDVFAETLLNLEDRGIRVLFSVHDEAVTEVDQDVSPRDVEAEMSKCPEWIKGLPLGAEAHEVGHYFK